MVASGGGNVLRGKVSREHAENFGNFWIGIKKGRGKREKRKKKPEKKKH